MDMVDIRPNQYLWQWFLRNTILPCGHAPVIMTTYFYCKNLYNYIHKKNPHRPRARMSTVPHSPIAEVHHARLYSPKVVTEGGKEHLCLDY